MIRHFVVVGALGSVAIALACSGGGVEGSCGNYFDALNALATQCDGTTLFDPNYRAAFLKDCDSLAMAPGATNFASQLDQCTSQIKSATCDNSILALDCVGRGTLPDQTACATGFQCTGGVCSTTSGSIPNSELSCGKCSSYVPTGGTCGNGLECDPTMGNCSNGKCVAYIQQGGACMITGCAPGLQCGTDMKCDALPGQGAACTFECASPYRCLGMVCAQPVAEGGACPMGDECASSLTCDAMSKTCVKPTLAQAGQPCGFINQQDVECASGLNCTQGADGGGETCVAQKGEGDSCVVGMQQCASGFICVSGTCQIPDYSLCQ